MKVIFWQDRTRDVPIEGKRVVVAAVELGEDLLLACLEIVILILKKN